MSSIPDFLKQLIQSNTGFSTKSALCIAVGILSLIILIVVAFSIVWEIVHKETIHSSLSGFADIITAVAGLLVSVCLPKAIADYGESKYNNKTKKDEYDLKK